MQPRVLLLSLINRNIWQKCSLESNVTCQLLLQTPCRNAGTRTVRPLRVTSLSKKKKPDRTRESSFTGNQRLLPDEDDSLDNIANTISKYSSKHAALVAEHEHTRELIKNLRFIKFKTLESNYFKKVSAPNLLTWSAKEQIQYLHQTDPKTWTVQTLSNLFPVSETDIRSVIKSKSRLHRDEDILQHDLTVQKNWADLKATLEKEDDDDTDDGSDVYQAFRNSDNEIIINNAMGVEDLPFPVRKQDKFNPKGLFSEIVTDCYEAKFEAKRKTEEGLRGQCEKLCAVLSEVAQILHQRSQEKTSQTITGTADLRSAPNVSETTYSRHLPAGRNAGKSNNAGKQKHLQENMNNFISPKYKDSSFPSKQHEDSAHPKSDVPNRIQVTEHKTKAETFLSRDCVYDQNGQFLYRIL